MRIKTEIWTLAVSMALCTSAMIDSPLASVADYRFTAPVNTNLIKGKIMGPSPQAFEPLRGEDLIYLYEAYGEMSAIREAKEDSAFSVLSGKDTIWLEMPFSVGRTAYTSYGFIHVLLKDNADTDYYYWTLINQKGKNATPATNIFMSTGYDLSTSRFAADAVARSGGVATNTAAMGNIFEGFGSLYATNVSAYYVGLKDIKGIARDLSTIDSTNEIEYVDEWIVGYASMDYYNHTWTYGSYDHTTTNIWSGWGIDEYVNYWTAIEVASGNHDYYGKSSPYTSHRKYKVVNSPTIYARLFPTNFANAARLIAQKAWILATCYVSWDERRYENSGGEDTYSDTGSNTTWICAVPATVTLSEEEGMIVANITGSASYAYDTVGSVADRMPADISYPPAPQNVEEWLPPFTPSESYENSNGGLLTIRPARIALILNVDWHTGFQNIGQP